MLLSWQTPPLANFVYMLSILLAVALILTAWGWLLAFTKYKSVRDGIETGLRRQISERDAKILGFQNQEKELFDIHSVAIVELDTLKAELLKLQNDSPK